MYMYYKNNVIIKFAGIDSIEDAENIRILLEDKAEDAIELPQAFLCSLADRLPSIHYNGYYLGKVNDVMKTAVMMYM